MPVKSIAVLKTFFETGDRPTESQFGDLIDSFIHKTTGSVVIGKSVDAVTGDVLIQFSDGDSIGFNVNPLESAEISFINGLQAALDSKVDKENGKGLSSNDFTNELLTKLNNLENFTLTNQEISFINGLQDALEQKANDNEVVKTVNFIQPDANGNVNIPFSVPYDLSDTPTFLNYSYKGKNVFGILFDIPTPDVDGNSTINHNLDIERYIKMNFSLSLQTSNDNGEGVEIVVSGGYVLTNDSIIINNVNDYNLDLNNDFLYIEYISNEPLTEGISADIVGVSAIGVD